MIPPIPAAFFAGKSLGNHGISHGFSRMIQDGIDVFQPRRLDPTFWPVPTLQGPFLSLASLELDDLSVALLRFCSGNSADSTFRNLGNQATRGLGHSQQTWDVIDVIIETVWYVACFIVFSYSVGTPEINNPDSLRKSLKEVQRHKTFHDRCGVDLHEMSGVQFATLGLYMMFDVALTWLLCKRWKHMHDTSTFLCFVPTTALLVFAWVDSAKLGAHKEHMFL